MKKKNTTKIRNTARCIQKPQEFISVQCDTDGGKGRKMQQKCNLQEKKLYKKNQLQKKGTKIATKWQKNAK